MGAHRRNTNGLGSWNDLPKNQGFERGHGIRCHKLKYETGGSRQAIGSRYFADFRLRVERTSSMRYMIRRQYVQNGKQMKHLNIE